MNASRWKMLLLLAVLPLVWSCGGEELPVRRFDRVSDDDPEMVAAVATARAALPRFWNVLERPTQGEYDFRLRVKVTDDQGPQQVWANNVERRDGKVRGTVILDPDVLTRLQEGQQIEIAPDAISDWMYARSGQVVGAFTLRPLLKQMTPEEVEQFKRMYLDE